MHHSELRTPLAKPLDRSAGTRPIMDLQGRRNRIIRQPSPTTSTVPCPCAWPTPSTRQPDFPLGFRCRAPAAGRGSASAWWDSDGRPGRACLGCPCPQDKPRRLRGCDGASGALIRRPSSGAELPAAPESGEHRFPTWDARRYKASPAWCGDRTADPSTCRPHEGPGERQGVWLSHLRPIRPAPNSKR